MKNRILMLVLCMAAVLSLGFVLVPAGVGQAHTPPADLSTADDVDEHNARHQPRVQLSESELTEFGVEMAVAGPGHLRRSVQLPGEILLNEDRMTHVVPRVSGIARSVSLSVGDRVDSGDLMAVIESRELADAKARFLAARERTELARANFEREQRLWHQHVTSEQEFLDARRALAESRIAVRSAQQQLLALGLSDAQLEKLIGQANATLTRFEIRAPFGGTIIKKHIVLGEDVDADANVFTIADLSSVWVDLSVHQKDLIDIRQGQRVIIELGQGGLESAGEIVWVSPQVDEETRTARARIVLPNRDGDFRPGLFVTGHVAVESVVVEVAVPKTAFYDIDGQTVVFVRRDSAIEPVVVRTGRRDRTHVEVLSGLRSGETYAAQGGFTLKAELKRDALDSGHHH